MKTGSSSNASGNSGSGGLKGGSKNSVPPVLGEDGKFSVCFLVMLINLVLHYLFEFKFQCIID
jgi:hypothetical protein